MAPPTGRPASSRAKIEQALTRSLERLPHDSGGENCRGNFNTLQFPGSLGALPLDIIWMILDEILMGDGRLSHSAICDIRKLSYATNKVVSMYMSDRTSKTLRFLSERLSEVKWHPWRDTIWGPMPLDSRLNAETLPIEEDVDAKSDLFTEIICADCPACFEWMSNCIHGLHCSGANENGWNFVSLAIQAGSLTMLKYFFTKQPETLPLLWSFSNYLSATADRPIQLLVKGKKVRFIEELLEFLEPRLNRINYSEAFRTGIAETPERNALKYELSKYRSSMSRFASACMAERLKKVGVDLCTFEDVYHAAIFNGRDFLDYHHHNSTVSKTYVHWFSGQTPFELAVEENRLESVLWLKRHGGDDIGPGNWAALLNKTASRLTAEAEAMLQELLTSDKGGIIGHFESARLVRAIVRGLVPFVKAEAGKRDAGNMTEDAFLSWKLQQEDRAIRKCALVHQVSWKTLVIGDHPIATDIVRLPTGLTTDIAVAVQKFIGASNTAQLAGLQYLASSIKCLFLCPRNTAPRQISRSS
ncbi:hypothetical protein PEBR_08088 [Penicillium brasilianum]|uniref:Uncharacterized protein n=1 Tax=Penicillium brasilianum TaxID=104259 RepID=A0A1S9RWH2_PENBI|nr:hypothetical protein PEBR_08088 [Penicillium brasilianum]